MAADKTEDFYSNIKRQNQILAGVEMSPTHEMKADLIPNTM